jgi:hypothetical protein
VSATLFDWAADAVPVADDRPLVDQLTRMAPAAIQARRSGRTATRSVTHPSDAMRVYRDTLRALQPATDHQVSAAIREALGLGSRDDAAFGLSSVNGRRNDWLDLQADCIEAVDRVKAPGARTSRTRWRIKAGSLADTWRPTA